MKTFTLLLAASLFAASSAQAPTEDLYADIDLFFDNEVTPFTQSAPGPWEGKQPTHVPVLVVDEAQNRGLVRIGAEPHEMVPGPEPPEHYIGYIWVKDQTGAVVGAGKFEPGQGTLPEIFFEIPEGTTELTAYEACNIHGVWVSETYKLGSGDSGAPPGGGEPSGGEESGWGEMDWGSPSPPSDWGDTEEWKPPTDNSGWGDTNEGSWQAPAPAPDPPALEWGDTNE
mmetsp:Transcript_45815/g.92458  ORF Transcript_45815/g.92458 Transcript_45815/m.92458 type:complete len:227 (+) Transcript_45815:646-1326(+)|eukprot:CAMPEP_0171622912 /NCGR_PEP_ID=MMETSP0990-20121206/17573_1 /TAXON_ID=483369 /ORGANISM="non described non described, Strain CCMP2098" /LENGTH=226 /DNA_ID=CAMNT_0012188895 /DNA_START=567 /DNA_END=1247 /DNA_ORIENTATION=-